MNIGDIANMDVKWGNITMHFPPLGQLMQVTGHVNLDPADLSVETGSGLTLHSKKFNLIPGQWIHVALVFTVSGSDSCKAEMYGAAAEGQISNVECLTKIACDPHIAATSYVLRPSEKVTYDPGDIPYGVYVAVALRCGPFKDCKAELASYNITFTSPAAKQRTGR